jgi:hypothetical protein
VQKLTAIRLVGHAVGADESQRLGGLQPVAVGRRKDTLLRLRRQGAQSIGDAGTDRPAGEFLCAARREMHSDGDSAIHPLGFPSEPTGDTAGA